MSDTPLCDALARYCSQNGARFHMPGHSGAGAGSLYASCAWDATELSGLGNLIEDRGVIAESEALAARDYGAKRALYLTQGSTCGMHIALAAACGKGGTALALGPMHKSFWTGAALFDIRVETAEDLPQAAWIMRMSRDISAVFYTSPDYFGRVADSALIDALCKTYGVLSVADAAHGAHFPYSSALPEPPAADIFTVSPHKTMAVYGGGAVLLLRDELRADTALFYRQMLHTSSPGYLVMASLDRAFSDWRRAGASYYREIGAARARFYSRMNRFRVCDSDDLSRLTLDTGEEDASAVAAAAEARGVFCEAAIGNRLVLILTPANAARLDEAAAVLGSLPVCAPYSPAEMPRGSRRPASGRVRFVTLEEAVGAVCAGEIGFYPPGVPLVRRGDVLDGETLQKLADRKNNLFGLVNGRVPVLQ